MREKKIETPTFKLMFDRAISAAVARAQGRTLLKYCFQLGVLVGARCEKIVMSSNAESTK